MMLRRTRNPILVAGIDDVIIADRTGEVDAVCFLDRVCRECERPGPVYGCLCNGSELCLGRKSGSVTMVATAVHADGDAGDQNDCYEDAKNGAGDSEAVVGCRRG